MLDPAAFNVTYFVVLPKQEVMDQTRFQGFSLGNYEARQFIYRVLTLPQNLLELKSSKIETIRARAMGVTSINLVPIEDRFLMTALALAPTPFNVLYSLASTHDVVVDTIKKVNKPLLHVSAIAKDGAISVEDFRFRSIWNFCNLVKDYIASQSQELLDLFVEVIGKKRKWRTDTCRLETKLHMLTRPNEVLLKSFNYGLKKGQPLRPNLTEEDYVENVSTAVKEVMALQQSILGKDLNSAKAGLVLTAFAMLKHRYDNPKPVRGDVEYAEFKRDIAKAIKILARQTGYKIQAEMDIMQSPAGQAVFGMRSMETDLYTMALSVAACNSFSPVLRLPPGVNLVGGVCKEIASCSRANANPNKQNKMNKLFASLQGDMSAYIHPKYIDIVRSSSRNIKIVSDAPLEWLSLDGLPLMLRKNTSRIPVTPGNTMLIQILRSQRLLVEVSELKKVLVLRSFDENDNLKYILTNAAKMFGSISASFKLEIIYRDIKSKSDLVEAINNFDGAIMIYDGHGSYDKKTDMSGLIVGGAFINVWELKEELKSIPPIILLSACDTHPIDSSHVTVANGFISLGAMTVMSTLMPVTAKDSAIMLGRLIYRIEEYLSIYLKIFGRSIRWNHLVTGLQRMVYMTDLKKYLSSRLNVELTEELYKDVGLKFNEYINSDDPNWYEKSLEYFSSKTGKSFAEIANLLSKGFFCESLKYIQIGNPENITIVLSKDDLYKDI